MAISALFAALLLGSWVYCALAIIAAARYLSIRRRASAALPAISILKPLAGLDEGLEDNLRSFFVQDYPDYEILFAVRSDNDPSVPIVGRLCEQHPAISARLIVTGEPAYPHGKVFSLARMLAESHHQIVVMSDSDVRVGPGMLRAFAGEFADPQLGISACPYRAVAGHTLWSKLEAAGMNTAFFEGVLTARMIDGMKFAIGPTMAARRAAIDGIGGLEIVKDFLSSEDFMIGKLAFDAGFGVILSSYIVEHRIGSETARQNFSHRLRWGRTSRRSRPGGYIGQFFTHPLPIALLVTAIRPQMWLALIATVIIRYAAGWMISEVVLGARLAWILLPAEDLLGFAFWIAGFFGNSIVWRGHEYRLDRQGRAIGSSS